MRKCPYDSEVIDVECVNPHLNCGQACPVFKKFKNGVYERVKNGLVRAPRFPRLPDPTPFVKVGGNPSGAPGVSITIGVKGTF